MITKSNIHGLKDIDTNMSHPAFKAVSPGDVSCVLLLLLRSLGITSNSTRQSASASEFEHRASRVLKFSRQTHYYAITWWEPGRLKSYLKSDLKKLRAPSHTSITLNENFMLKKVFLF